MRVPHLEEPEELVEEDFDKLILHGQSLYCKKFSDYGAFGEIHKEKTEVKVPKDELLLGVKTKGGDDPVTLKIGDPMKSFGLLIPAVRGAGKSGFAKTLIDRVHEKGCKIVAFETKGFDFQTMDAPQDDPKGIEMLNKFGLKPRAYKLANVIPAFVADEFTKAKSYRMDVSDFNELPYATQITLWCQFLGIKEMSSPGKALQRVLKMGAGGKPPRSVKEMINFTLTDISQQRRDRKKQGAGGNVSTSLLYLLEQKIRTNELGRGQSFDPVQALAENDVLVFNAPFDSKNLSSMCVYIAVFLQRIINDRNNYVKTGGRKGVLSDPIVIFVEESDSIISSEDENNLAAHILYSVLARYRQIGISLVLVTQNPALIRPRFIRQCSFIAVTRVESEEVKQLLRIRGTPRYIIENQLSRMDFSITSPVKQWALAGGEDTTDPPMFFPIFPCTRLVKEGESVM